MIKSMTGFGRAEMTFDDLYEVKIQIKSVNHRYADYTIKTPRIYSFLEESIRAKLSQNISRGKIEVYVSINKINDDSKEVKINLPLAESYINNLRELSDFGVKDDISMSSMCSLSDIFEVQYKEIDEEAILNMINTALDAALEDFLNMRINEGSRLNNSILEHLNILSSEVEKVEKLSPETITKYKERLEKRLRDALSELESGADDSRILTEVAIFSDKVAVDEETVRLNRYKILNKSEANMKLINVGFGNIVSGSRVIAIVSPDSAPIKRIIQEAKERGMVIDATCGRRTRSVIVTDSDHIILSAIQTETIAGRAEPKSGDENIEDGGDDDE